MDRFDDLLLSLLADAIAEERSAYADMRSAVPQMGLPAQRRGEMSGEQMAAIQRYDVACARVSELRRSFDTQVAAA